MPWYVPEILSKDAGANSGLGLNRPPLPPTAQLLHRLRHPHIEALLPRLGAILTRFHEFNHAFTGILTRFYGKMPWCAPEILSKQALRNGAGNKSLPSPAGSQLLHRLRHPHIVAFVDSFVHDAHLCIVMAYCASGATLSCDGI